VLLDANNLLTIRPFPRCGKLSRFGAGHFSNCAQPFGRVTD